MMRSADDGCCRSVRFRIFSGLFVIEMYISPQRLVPLLRLVCVIAEFAQVEPAGVPTDDSCGGCLVAVVDRVHNACPATALQYNVLAFPFSRAPRCSRGLGSGAPTIHCPLWRVVPLRSCACDAVVPFARAVLRSPIRSLALREACVRESLPPLFGQELFGSRSFFAPRGSAGTQPPCPLRGHVGADGVRFGG